ncbi:amt family ammonium transporter [Neohortaea acidophila]|uniref:Ammonium transporter n=1 Tax=Neohortaea acidophila TaxID=245834 RepID=A0A6A6PMK9_9PEZI|nr:amt family ammonium transporter [Neohortaea acidophila]KAF2481320.1 amt family ammonium transporter [Neohortaea acidophila]
MTSFGTNYNSTILENPPWLDTGDNAWQLTAASLVGLQSIPGLTVLYAGLVKRKWVINSMFMTFYAFAMVLLCWSIWAYNVGFGQYMLPFAGKPGPLLTIGELIRQSDLPSTASPGPLSTQDFPKATMAYFQFVFAAITLVLIAGGYLGRMNFTAWMVFVPLWLTFSYCVGAYSLWGGGYLFKLGVIDYSGGYVIHLSSGTAAFTGAYWIGPRLKQDRQNFQPSNIPLMMVGAGIVWIGWNGFNGGDPYSASPDAGVAVFNTNLCTATSLLTWMCMDLIFYKKPSLIGAVNGMITGLVAITPAAGVIAGWGAIIMGVCSGTVPWLSMNIAGKRMRLFTHHVDDTLGITHTHMVAGALGGFLVGIFATPEGSEAFGLANYGGAITGNGKQVWLQIVGALFIIGWNLVWTSLILLFIKYVLRIPLRYSDELLLIGDDALHGEDAYCFYDNVDGLEPSPSAHLRALDLEKHSMPGLGHVRTGHLGRKDDVLEGIVPAEGSASGSGGGDVTPPVQKTGDGMDIKSD